MTINRTIRSLCAGLGVAGLVLGASQVSAASHAMKGMKGPSIDGTYRFVSRDLPDGTKVDPPVAIGLMTLSHGYRNLTITWKDANGKRTSMSYMAKYTFTPTEYTETSLYYAFDDQASGKPATYDVTETTKSAPVTEKDGEISFTFPHNGEPAVVFDSKGMTATRPGVFVDHWVRVK
jgi:hypothetical protein